MMCGVDFEEKPVIDLFRQNLTTRNSSKFQEFISSIKSSHHCETQEKNNYVEQWIIFIYELHVFSFSQFGNC